MLATQARQPSAQRALPFGARNIPRVRNSRSPSMDRKTLLNPVYPAYFADPFCFLHNNTYYAIGTGKDEADACPTTRNDVPMNKSHDLQTWLPIGHVQKPPQEEKGGCFWAPEIAYDGKTFYMYYHPNGNGRG